MSGTISAATGRSRSGRSGTEPLSVQRLKLFGQRVEQAFRVQHAAWFVAQSQRLLGEQREQVG
ncbi:MAG: hypothetical protein H0V41_06820 [Pseudonocardiales bacterium]|nr:hypothetical protein [Pseudonocardiales bacterium]